MGMDDSAVLISLVRPTYRVVEDAGREPRRIFHQGWLLPDSKDRPMSKKISKQERERRQQQAARDRQQRDRDRLLYTRSEVARLFGVSIATIIRMENDGRLPGLKLGPSQNHRTLYRAADVHRLAGLEQVA
jgi:DNA-binding XRE family transcriptional regulator